MVTNRLFEDYELGHTYQSAGRKILPDEVKTDWLNPKYAADVSTQ